MKTKPPLATKPKKIPPRPKQYLGVEISNVFCTKIASKLVRTYTDSHGLKELCRELLGQQISKQQQSSAKTHEPIHDKVVKTLIAGDDHGPKVYNAISE